MRVAAGLVEHNGLWLLAQRHFNQKLAGYWEFPGGKLEANESPLIALARELKEELSIEVEPLSVIGEFKHQYEFGPITLIGVLARTHSSEFVLHEHQAAGWFRVEQIGDLLLAPADTPLYEWLKQR